MKKICLSIFLTVTIIFITMNLGYAKEDCLPLNDKNAKVEIWLSKKYEKNYRNIRQEFNEMGNTKVGLFIYPAENPSRVVAIGRCVPVHIAQYFLKKAKKYSLGTTHLVNQGFVSSHWSGLGTSLFSEHSMNAITQQQLAMLMDENLDTQSFQKLYQSFTVQKTKAPAFGLMVDNPKLLGSIKP